MDIIFSEFFFIFSIHSSCRMQDSKSMWDVRALEEMIDQR